MSSPQLLATTQIRFHARPDGKNGATSGFFKSAQWSPDGTCVVTNASDNVVRTHVVPHDLLLRGSDCQDLGEYSAITSAGPIDALVLYPYFDLQDPSTNLLISAANEQPVRLTSTATAQLLASYPLVNPTAEAYIKPNSLIFSLDGSQFLAGSDSCVSVFDLSRPGQEPITSLQTGPKRANSFANPSQSMRGRISAMSVDQRHKILAAGTYTRHIGLYDSSGRGDCVGVFCVQGTEADNSIQGNGITQLLWSPCGRYLCIAERKSDGVMIYDIRMTGQLMSWLEERNAYTNQRMSIDLAHNPDSGVVEIWAGGLDGSVRMWSDPFLSEGGLLPSSTIPVHANAVNSAGIHRYVGILATTSGQRSFDAMTHESTLRLWTV